VAQEGAEFARRREKVLKMTHPSRVHHRGELQRFVHARRKQLKAKPKETKRGRDGAASHQGSGEIKGKRLRLRANATIKYRLFHAGRRAIVLDL